MSRNKKILEESLRGGEKKPETWSASQNRAPFPWVATASTRPIAFHSSSVVLSFFSSVIVNHSDMSEEFAFIYNLPSLIHLQESQEAILDIKKEMSLQCHFAFAGENTHTVSLLLFGLNICTDYRMLSQFLVTSTVISFNRTIEPNGPWSTIFHNCFISHIPH